MILKPQDSLINTDVHVSGADVDWNVRVGKANYPRKMFTSYLDYTAKMAVPSTCTEEGHKLGF